MCIFLPSCSGRKKQLAPPIAERDSLPGLRTLGVNTLISDSGIIRYKVITDEWDIYDRKQPPYWAFERGVYLEKFDSLFHVEATIKADTAYYYEKDKLWELRHNVHIQNLQGDEFDTHLLFWNESTGKVYSSAYIRIKQSDNIISGYGFESNQQLTDYQIFNSTGIIAVDEEASVDSTQISADSLRTTRTFSP